MASAVVSHHDTVRAATFPVSKSNTMLYLTNENMACVVLVRPFISPFAEKKRQIKLSWYLKSSGRPNLLAASSVSAATPSHSPD